MGRPARALIGELEGRLALRPPEAAEALGVSERTLRKWMRDDGLPFFRLDGVVCLPVAGLREWMEERVRAAHRADEVADEVLRDLSA